MEELDSGDSLDPIIAEDGDLDISIANYVFALAKIGELALENDFIFR